MPDERAHDGVVLFVDLAVSTVLLVLVVVSSAWWLPVALGWGLVSTRQVAVLRRSRWAAQLFAGQVSFTSTGVGLRKGVVP